MSISSSCGVNIMLRGDLKDEGGGGRGGERGGGGGGGGAEEEEEQRRRSRGGGAAEEEEERTCGVNIMLRGDSEVTSSKPRWKARNCFSTQELRRKSAYLVR